MREITARLSPKPQSHLNHRMLGAWFTDTINRIDERQTTAPPLEELLPTDKVEETDLDLPDVATGGAPRKGIIPKLSHVAAQLQEKMFGSIPLVRRTHPLLLDTAAVAEQLAALRRSGHDRILWLSSRYSFFHKLMPGPAQSPQLLLKGSNSPVQENAPYDACLCELNLSELSSLPALYANIRQIVDDRAEILIYVHTLGRNPLRGNPFAAYEEVFPAVDASTVRFHGNGMTALIRKMYLKGSRQFAHRPRIRALMAAGTLLALAPFAWVANSLAARRDATKFAPGWTSVILHFVVKKKRKTSPLWRSPQAPRFSLEFGLTPASARAREGPRRRIRTRELGGTVMGQGSRFLSNVGAAQQRSRACNR